MYKKNVNKMLSKTLLQLTEFCSSVFVIDFGQVNAPWEMIMSLQYVFQCSKSTIETLGKDVKNVQS